MEHEVKEHLTVDSVMTADGEVVPLPTLGPLGPVDAEGGRIPLDTKELLDAHGECRKVESYEFSTWSQRWVVHFDSGPGSYADDCHLTPPDSLEKSLHSAPDRDIRNWSVGSMALTRRYDGEPIVRVELDTSVELDVSVNGSCGETVGADVTATAYIEDIKYCPFCGEEL